MPFGRNQDVMDARAQFLSMPRSTTAHPVAADRPGLWMVCLGILFMASLLGTLLMIWPQQREAPTTAAAAMPATVVAPPPAAEADPQTTVATPQSGVMDQDEDPARTAAALAEPALLDLLDDAGSSDPWVREDAQRLLRDRDKPQ
jgi:hypothetical protein